MNVAGEALRIEGVAGQERFVTKDQSFTASAQGEYTSWSANDRLHLLRRTGPSTAVLKGSKQLTGSLSDLVGDGDRLYVTSRPQSYYYGYYYDVSVGGSTTESSDRLSIFDLTGDALNQRFSAPVGHYGSQLMGVYNNHLFINISGDGVLAVDVSNAGAPQGRHFVRTLGWATHLVFEGTRAFIAAGNFGIYELDLGAAPTIARLN